MKAFLAIFTILSALVYCQAAVRPTLGRRIECLQDAQTRIYESKIRKALEGLRDQLKVGMPDKNIPPMDPFVLDNVNLNIDSPAAKLDWSMHGNIAGLMSWELTNIKFALLGLKLTFEMNFPQIVGKGTYDIDGTVVQVLPLFGSGNFDVTVQNLTVSGTASFNVLGPSITRVNIGLALEDFDFDVDGLMNDEPLSFLLSQMITDSVPELLKNFEKEINNVLSNTIKDMVNGILQGKKPEEEVESFFQPDSDDLRLLAMECGDY